MTDDMEAEPTFVELAEREDREAALALAKQRALDLICLVIASDRSWLLTKEQWQRFRANANPLEEFREETEMFVAREYERIRGWWSYEKEQGPFHYWSRGGGRPHPYGIGVLHKVWACFYSFIYWIKVRWINYRFKQRVRKR